MLPAVLIYILSTVIINSELYVYVCMYVCMKVCMYVLFMYVSMYVSMYIRMNEILIRN